MRPLRHQKVDLHTTPHQCRAIPKRQMVFKPYLADVPASMWELREDDAERDEEGLQYGMTRSSRDPQIESICQFEELTLSARIPCGYHTVRCSTAKVDQVKCWLQVRCDWGGCETQMPNSCEAAAVESVRRRSTDVNHRPHTGTH